MTCKIRILLFASLLSSPISWSQEAVPEEVFVFDVHREAIASELITRTIDSEELSLLNSPNLEDALAYQPNLIVRKRYIGDINSTMGMRGSNMYQTTRSMVFSDGLPLHYLLQTQFSGAPRWSLVAPSEIDSLQVIYGPFSAEYSGNAMGGVVEIETRQPRKREVNLSLSAYSQKANAANDEDSHPGFQGFFSYENVYGGLGVYFSLLHMENESQVLTLSSASPDESLSGQAVSGTTLTRDSLGNQVFVYGDQGPEKASSDLAKLKFYFDSDNLHSQLTFGYEDRQRKQESPQSYLRDSNGEEFWRGEASVDRFSFLVDPAEFYLRDQNRESLIVGFSSSGPIFAKGWTFDLDVSRFDILKDEDIESLGTFEDPAFDGAATLSDVGGSNWTTANLKLGRETVFYGRNLDLAIGLYHDKYQFQSARYEANFASGAKLSELDGAGGTTSTSAVFFHSKWDITESLSLGAGLRVEHWESTDELPLTPDTKVNREASRSSPKFSLGYQMSSSWQLEYAFARAYRFPIVEELFENERQTSGSVIANANLQPEDGRHHNLLLQRQTDVSLTRFTLFYEDIRDVIFNQTRITPRVRTFLPVDQVETTGLEFSQELENIVDTPFRISFNAAYLHSQVIKNTANPDTQGNYFPRMPKFRVNALVGYELNEELSLSAGLRYQSNSYGRIDNNDREEEVFGAHDDFMFVNLKLDYQVARHMKLSFGVDNLTNDVAYVFSPWPGRTLFTELALKL